MHFLLYKCLNLCSVLRKFSLISLNLVTLQTPIKCDQIMPVHWWVYFFQVTPVTSLRKKNISIWKYFLLFVNKTETFHKGKKVIPIKMENTQFEPYYTTRIIRSQFFVFLRLNRSIIFGKFLYFSFEKRKWAKTKNKLPSSWVNMEVTDLSIFDTKTRLIGK